MGAHLSFRVELESTTCATCGVEFAAPSHLIRSKRENRGQIFCPSGHVGTWSETEADRLRKLLADRDRELLTKESALKFNRERAEKAEGQRDTAKKKLGRLTENGVCPCCRRNFSALARHMKTKHPDWRP